MCEDVITGPKEASHGIYGRSDIRELLTPSTDETQYYKGGAIALGIILEKLKIAREKGYSIDVALEVCEEERKRWLNLLMKSQGVEI